MVNQPGSGQRSRPSVSDIRLRCGEQGDSPWELQEKPEPGLASAPGVRAETARGG